MRKKKEAQPMVKPGRPTRLGVRVDNDGMTPQQARALRTWALDHGISFTHLKQDILMGFLTDVAKMSREEQGITDARN